MPAVTYQTMNRDHRGDARISTRRALERMRGGFEEVNFRDFENPGAVSRRLPLVSCGFRHCSALVLAVGDAFGLTHMLTISGKATALDYIDDLLERFRGAGVAATPRDAKGLLIAGAGQGHVMAACAERGVAVRAAYVQSACVRPTGLRDVIVYPDERRVDVHGDDGFTALRID